MAIIYTFPQKSQPVGADKLIITDSEDNNATKTVTIADIRDATVSGVESLIAGDNITLDPAGGTGNVTVSTTGEADKIVEVVYNNTGNTINKGQPLHITGVNGTIPTVNIADASDPTLMPVSGLANEDIPTMSSGEMIVSGILEGIDTNGIDGVPTNAEAVIIYVSDSTGGSIDYLSANAPTGESNQIQNIGIIVKDSPGTSGSLQVTAIGRSNATPNLDRGSIFIGDALNQSSTLAIGASTHVLTSDGNTASWAAIPTQAAEDLATTLAAGNTTGGNDISITGGDSIIFSNVPWNGELSVASLTANRTYALPNQSGTLPVGPAWNSLISTVTPGSGQDGYVITWNDASNEYQLLAAAASGGGIYGGSGSLSGNTTVTQGTNRLRFNHSSLGSIDIGDVNATTSFGVNVTSAAASTNNYGGYFSTSGSGGSTDFNVGVVGKADNAPGTNIGVVGSVNGIYNEPGYSNVGVVGSIDGSDNNAVCILASQRSTTTGSSYGVRYDDTNNGNANQTAYAFSVNQNAANDVNYGLYISTTSGTTRNVAIATVNGQSGFGTTTPDPSAIVDVESATQGFKVPTIGGVGAVSPSPTAASAGLIIFDTNTNQFQGWNGTSWVILG